MLRILVGAAAIGMIWYLADSGQTTLAIVFAGAAGVWSQVNLEEHKEQWSRAHTALLKRLGMTNDA